MKNNNKNPRLDTPRDQQGQDSHKRHPAVALEVTDIIKPWCSHCIFWQETSWVQQHAKHLPHPQTHTYGKHIDIAECFTWRDLPRYSLGSAACDASSTPANSHLWQAHRHSWVFYLERLVVPVLSRNSLGSAACDATSTSAGSHLWQPHSWLFYLESLVVPFLPRYSLGSAAYDATSTSAGSHLWQPHSWVFYLERLVIPFLAKKHLGFSSMRSIFHIRKLTPMTSTSLSVLLGGAK